ncbi:O-antigen biosynthesis glycosyltransferase WbnJ [Vibrio owensii]|uniref:glycosyltransferase n=1 Tax=Vibrio owensii TaxID=696485 RepID=UPI002894A0B8|nr:O-antigen biosynthesis glycosyltransferase WbnJ [Vibrio owensii]
MISILMPVHKNDEYLLLAVDSVLRQTYSEFELLILANGDEKELIKKTIEKRFTDERIKVFTLNISQLPFILNYGVEKSKGEYIARMDGDDICLETRLEEQLEYLNENKLDFLGSDYDLIDDQGSLIRHEVTNHDFETIKKRLVIGNQFCHPSVLMRKSSIIKSKGYSFGFFSEDYELWIRMVFEHGLKGENINRTLLQYRIHDGQATNKYNRRRNFAYAISLSVLSWLKYRKVSFLLSAIWQFNFVKKAYFTIKRVRNGN